MKTKANQKAAEGNAPRRLFVYNGGFLTQTRVRRILELSNWEINLGKPGGDDWVGVWGKSPTSGRGETVARNADAPLLTVEDTFLRSVHPGRSGDLPIGLNLDASGVHFDSSKASDLETMLATNALDDTAILNRARLAIGRLRRAHLSKYNAFDPSSRLPKAPYVLVIDQTRGDAAIEHSGASAATFAEMLVFAQTEHPGSRIVIKSHPEIIDGHREGHFGPDVENGQIRLLSDPVSPWALMEGATAVYTVSSQMGFEAIFAGHKPRVFGQPFYAGWGLTHDENPVARRERTLTRAQLFAAAMILYPVWYDPNRDRLCDLEEAISALEADVRAWREDRFGYVAVGMRRWKRPHLQRFFGSRTPVKFAKTLAEATKTTAETGAIPIIWASGPQAGSTNLERRVEDGFLRSRGLGANLIAPLSLVIDDLGIYYDPRHESRLERFIAASVDLPEDAKHRAERLIQRIIKDEVSKYNLQALPIPTIPKGHRILVAGQVEDDASVILGCGAIKTNRELLERVRAENPTTIILYKPHPDVEAGLRSGFIGENLALEYADMIVPKSDPIELIEAVDAVATMTSLLGFEALIRGKPVTCYGTPFYAGWGLTTDIGDSPNRRKARPDLAGLVHAALIDYPRYFDPVSQLPCPVEVVVERLASGTLVPTSFRLRLMAKLQGYLPAKVRR